MPEGDTIFRAARTLHRVLAGKIVTRFESVFPALTRVADDAPIVGRKIEAVAARGKHLLMTFSGDVILRTHMKMNGSWHTYPAGAKWQRPLRDMRIVVGTSDAVAVGFNVPVAEFLTSRDLARHKELSALGPDLLAPVASTGDARRSDLFDREDAVRRLRAHGRDAIGDVLLNQRVMSGIGNVFKSEILFLAGIDPFRLTATLTDAEVDRVIGVALKELRANVLTSAQSLTTSVGRRTTRSLDPDAALYVYGRGGKPCRRCGSIVMVRKTGTDARLTYWCSRCQT
jgi:endonuclease-8